MRLTDEVYLVGGGSTMGFGLSENPDCHIYLVDGGDEMALIDCGLGAEASLQRIVENVRAEGLDPAKITKIILTHYHMDHAGGAAAARVLLEAEIVCPAEAAEVMRSGDERAVALDTAKAAGLYPPEYHFAPVEVETEVREGDRVAVGSLELEVIETPGHCDGHVSYLMRGQDRTYLFAGDAIFSGGRIVLQNIHDCSVPKTVATIAKLNDITFDALLPGHGPVAMRDGMSHVQSAHEACSKLFLPKNLI
ncbi:MAG: MBL fold metallo-hydrolase [Thermomicrobiales bacterium]|nr:MBL fold metallo-hydrolase [Thermomicrobiales bacterium]